MVASYLHNDSVPLLECSWRQEQRTSSVSVGINELRWSPKWILQNYLSIGCLFKNTSKSVSTLVKFPIRVAVSGKRREDIWICPWKWEEDNNSTLKIQPKSNSALAGNLHSLYQSTSHSWDFLENKNQERITFLMTLSMIYLNKCQIRETGNSYFPKMFSGQTNFPNWELSKEARIILVLPPRGGWLRNFWSFVMAFGFLQDLLLFFAQPPS